jgi:hypothetical protein
MRIFGYCDERNKFVSILAPYVNFKLSLRDVITCLKTYAYDSERDKFLEIMCSKIQINTDDIREINNCYAYGSKKLALLRAIDQNIASRIDKADIKLDNKEDSKDDDKETKINIIKFLESNPNNDMTTYQILRDQNVRERIDITNIEQIYKYFKDPDVAEKIYQLFGVAEEVYAKQLILSRDKTLVNPCGKMYKTWVDNVEVDIKGGIFRTFESEHGTLRISGNGSDYSLYFNGPFGTMSMCKVDIRQKHIYTMCGGFTLKTE